MTKELDMWRVLQRRELFVDEPWIRLSAEQVLLPDGQVVDTYYQIGLREYAVVFAVTPEGKVIVDRGYKHGVRGVSLMLPSGLIEKGEEPSRAAQRELLEETGYVAEDWQGLGRFIVSANYGCGKAHLFKARSARRVDEPKAGDLEEVEIVLMSLDELQEAVRRGEVVLVCAAAAIALATHPMLSRLE